MKKAFNNASILARGISNGGTYLGYEYDYVKCIEFFIDCNDEYRR